MTRLSTAAPPRPPTPSLRPTGRRRVTPAMLQAKLENELTPMAEASRGQVIVAFKRAAPALGVPRPLVAFLLYLVSRTQPVDWEEGGRPLSFPSNRDIQRELDVGPSRVRALARQAAELGLLVCADGPTGHRYGRRDRTTGQIVHGYGFDLSPLSRRHAEFLRAIAAQEEGEREARRLRAHIMARKIAILELVACGLRASGSETELVPFSDEAERLVLLRRDEWNPRTLSVIAMAFDDLQERLEACLSVVLSVESAGAGVAFVRPITTTNPSASAYATSETEGRSAPSTDRNVGSPPGASSTVPVSLATSAADCPLRGFQAPPRLLLQLAPALRDLVPSSRPSESQIIEAAALLASSMGISPHAWGQACHVLGRYAAAVVIAVVSIRLSRGQVRSPGGYLRQITTNHLNGILQLDRTLFGLVDRLGVRGHA